MDRILDAREYTTISQDPVQVQLSSGTNPTSLRLIAAAEASPYYVSHTYTRDPEQVIITLSGSLDQFLASLQV